MVSETETEGRCNAEIDGGYCEGWQMDNGRCHKHGGRNDDDERDAGGAPEGNANATKHFAFRRPDLLEDDIQGTHYEDVFTAAFEALCTRHREMHGSDPDFFDKRRYRRFVIKDIKEDLIDAYLDARRGSSGSENPLVESQVTEMGGEPMNVEKANKLLAKMSDLSREIRLGLKDHGLLRDPASEQAQATREVAERWREALESQ